ncbi:MAG TPA: Npt1/Npt2 family nucleotide transporter [Bacteroidales bacterium]|nr:Npt1/Npt2 family nucleotide transporter [Bacteroidales bacterium]
MRERLFALLGVESGEESMVSWLLMQSVFIGVFFGSFDISAHSLFLSIFDEKMMARGYVVSGVAGIILTSTYTLLQSKLKFRIFSVGNLIAVTALTILLWTALLFSSAKWVVFLVFIMLGPLNILAALGFWGTAGRLFTLRQGKRLFGLVDSGLIVGIIISCYTVPVVLSLNFASKNILLISAASVFIATIIQIVIGSRYRIESDKVEKTEDEEPKKQVFSLLLKDRYTAIMAVFVALSVMTAFFVQYSFMAVTREQYPSEEDMARFLGIFTGSMMIFTLLVKLLAFSYLIRNYGLKICLALGPLLLAVFTLLAIGLGMAMGYTPEATSGFLIFFLVLALSRLFSKSLKDSIESPSFKVIYQTLDEKIRYNVQSGMDGTVNEISALTSGLLLSALGLLSFIKLIHFSAVLIIIIFSWILVAFMLYNEYRKSIRKALEPAAVPQQTEGTQGTDLFRSRFYARLAIKDDYTSLILQQKDSISIKSERNYIEGLLEKAESGSDLNLVPVLKKLSQNQDLDKDLRSITGTVAEQMQQKISQSQGRREHASVLLSGNRTPQTSEILRLLRDNSTESRRFAIYMIGKFRLTDMLTEVCECLGNPSLETDATAVLRSFGADAAPEMMRYFMSSTGNSDTCNIVLRLLSDIKTAETSSFLFSRLWSISRIVKETAVRGLIKTDYRPSEEERDRLHQLISDTIGLLTWNLSAKVCLEREKDTCLLPVINKDLNRWRGFLFDMLSVAYDRGSIAKIRSNLEKDTVESVNFALEMIDLVIDETIKAKITALLDTVPDEEKLKNLWHFYPGEVPSYKHLIEGIINRDYNLLSIWTKVCTLRNMKNIDDGNLAESVAALLFSPEIILQEEAARLISGYDLSLYKAVSQRISGSVRTRLDYIVEGNTRREELLYEKIDFLLKCFPGIPEEELLVISEKMVFTKDFGSGSVPADDCILWPLGKSEDKPYIFYSRSATQLKNLPSAESFYYLSLNSVEEFSNHFPERSVEILKYIEMNES